MAKTCFVIGPIGEEGTDTRRRADNMLQHVVKNVLEAEGMGYKVTRSDAIDQTGSVTSQIVEKVRDADLVIADLFGLNANVVYELALRHVEGKPVIMLNKPGQELPFDFQQNRAIDVDLTDLQSVAACKDQLKQQAKHAEKNPDEASENPVTAAIRFRVVQQSEGGEVLGTILNHLEQIEARLVPIRSARPVAGPLRSIARFAGLPDTLPAYDAVDGSSMPPMTCGRCGQPITSGPITFMAGTPMHGRECPGYVTASDGSILPSGPT